MEFIEKNAKQIGIISVVLLVIGFSAAFFFGQSEKKETEIQNKLAQIELTYSKYKEDFAKSQMPRLTGDPKSKETEVEKKAKDQELAQLKESVLSNQTKLTTDLEKFISDSPQSVATSMAALYLSELLLDQNKKTEALDVLKKNSTSTSGLPSILVQKKLASLMADTNQCDQAVKVWDQILSNKQAQFAYAEIKILQSLCYQKNNDLKKAEELLTAVKNDKSEGATEFSQKAEKMLRLIQFKKSSGT